MLFDILEGDFGDEVCIKGCAGEIKVSIFEVWVLSVEFFEKIHELFTDFVIIIGEAGSIGGRVTSIIVIVVVVVVFVFSGYG